MRIIKKRKKWGGSRGGDIAIFILLVLIGLFMLFPIYLSVIQSIKPVEELFVFRLSSMFSDPPRRTSRTC